ncbi:MAG: flagellar motor protein MotB [Bdellovibrionia bacterium]
MKKRKSAEHSSSERWLVSYADLVTLLFALFVILYAESKADMDKLKKVQEGMREAFDGTVSTQVPSQGSSQAPSQAPSQGNDTASPTGQSTPDPFAQMKGAIQETLKSESGVTDVSDKVELSEDDRGLVVRLAARDFFDDGVVEARADLRPLLDRIAKVLAPISHSIRVEGFTDIEEENQTGGWELSSARAAWVVKYWVKRWGFDPARLSASGYSHFHPLTQRKDDYSRGKNRRVEIIILRTPKAT